MKAFVTIAAMLVASSLNAQSLTVADSSSSGTYKAMLAEIKDVCSTDTFTINETPQKGGATENLEALVNNQASAAFLHSDVIYSAAMADPNYRNLKTLVALYPEEIHILTLRTSTTKPKTYNPFASAVQFNSLSDLKDWNVGAAGGSVITARLLTGQGDGKFNVVAFDNGKEVLDALKSGAVQAAIFVGGAPLPNLTPLKAEEFKLISIGESISARMNGVYRLASINYSNLRSGPVKTLAPQALIVTRKYTTPKMVEPQMMFRACITAKLDELKETPGKHPKWQLVDPNDHGVWEWYELPTLKPAVVRK